MERSESIRELAKALAAFRAELPTIYRNRTVSVKMKTGGSYSFDYTTLDHILDTAVPVLSKHGLSLSQFVVEGGIFTILMHESGQFLEGLTPFGKLSYSSAQDLGGVITYLRRYAIAAVLGIASEEDDDANRASGNRATQKPKKTLKPKPEKSMSERLEEWGAKNNVDKKTLLFKAGSLFGVTTLDELSVDQGKQLVESFSANGEAHA